MSKLKERKFYNGLHYILDEKAQNVRLCEKFHNDLINNRGQKFKIGFKKFGGSSIGEVFETDTYKSKFKAFCFISQLSIPALQMKYINAGNVMEGKVFEWLKTKFPKDKYPDIDIQHIEAPKVDYDYFKNKSEFIGGVPDGILDNNGIKSILELKAVGAKKQEWWEKNGNSGVPADYKKQAQLYAYLLGYDTYSIVATYLNEDDYDNLDNVNLDKQVFKYNFKVNKQMAKDDIDYVQKFWEQIVETGISPQYKLPRDLDLVEYLRCHNKEEWKQLFDRWKQEKKVDDDIIFE
ncbi:MAGa7180 family putative nuclease [Mycoplasma sp. Mirounga ES2805-ORL]|uniref:MAGa7180 family putative nuclease n=1 Tax=Mycoplasma sp. Mirounga ES2805-ORL TaxID=754514 RepID=UPI00197C22FB|nr:YqaJ viral recombinase family protein [Mycoplasma sp. Mirounga ES2805-ORL]QSF13771.1 hypothetical protein JXZ90_00510 [Mycoplasma sp. Mirounga ES2805-ORL]